ncbi:MAG TPA: four helix bundle protein [Thermoanaerobaculia bacterium]|nr:four helix bundle protein [Thermoanaerobaculia bacterium]
MQDFRNLKVWAKAHQLTLNVYAATKDFPRDETYGLRSRLRSASSSIGMNIAEGCGRNGDKEFGRFLHFSMGSASELEYQLLLAHDLGLIKEARFRALDKQTAEIKKMLSALLGKLRADS